MNSYKIICEAIRNRDVPFIVHKHNARSASEHYDIRFVNPWDTKKLFSFAAPKDFLNTVKTKTVLAKTKDHDPRWLTLKSYRLKEIDKGTVTINIATSKYFEIIFKGNILKGKYKLFKLKKTLREDRWLLVKGR